MRYEFATRPYHHQAAALSKLRRGGFGGALLMEPRTGKTKVSVDYMCIEAIANDVRQWIVVSPRRVIPVWRREIANHRGWIVDDAGARRRVKIRLQVWDAEARRKGPPANPNSQADLSIVLVNYEAFSGATSNLNVARLIRWCGCEIPRQRKTKRRRKSAPAYVQPPARPCGMVLDESHKIKSPSGNAALMIVSMQNLFARRLILTGTPITGQSRLADAWMQWQFLNPARFADLPTHGEFKDHYARWIQKGGWEEMGQIRPEGMADIRRRMHLDSFAVRRAECFDMPDPTPRTVHVDLTRRTREIYETFAEELIVQIQAGTMTAFNAGVASQRLSQIAAGVTRLGEPPNVTTHRISREKLDALGELLEESFERDEKVVVACRFREDIRSVLLDAERRWPKIPAYRLDGTVDPNLMAEELDKFRDLPGSALYVIQPQAGGVGIDLSTASRFVWYTLDLSWTNYKQCSDRVALNPLCDIVHLIARGTVDVRHLRSLRGDGEVGRWMIERPELLRLTDDEV